MAQDNKNDKIYNSLNTITTNPIYNYVSDLINVSSKVNEIIMSTNTNNLLPPSIPSSFNQNHNNNKKSSDSLITTIKLFIESIPQSFLLMCVLILFILFFIVIIIILICLIKKRKKLLQTETIVNNNKIDINKMILRNSNSLRPNLKEFHSIQNDSNIMDSSNGPNNMSLSEIKEKNLKEEIHSIVSGTLCKMIINKSKKIKRKKKGKNIKNGKSSPKSENKNIINTDKELMDETQKNKNNNIII